MKIPLLILRMLRFSIQRKRDYDQTVRELLTPINILHLL